MPVQGQSGVAIQRLRHETLVAESTGNHGLQKENQARHGHRRHASRQTKHLLCPFEDNTVLPSWPANKDCDPSRSFSVADVSKTFKCVNPRKADGPDNIPSRVLRACADQLAGVFTDIFNQCLSQSPVPTCFKMATIVPVPKKAKKTELNDYSPVALTSVIMKCFERLVKDHITSTLLATLDPLQFAYRPNRSTDDAIAITLP